MKTLFLTSIFLIICLGATPQFYSSGQAPTSVKWDQIKTENFQIIYPQEFYREANRAANLLEYMYAEISADYDVHPKKISVILYNQSVVSNGYVAWAPKRAEWVTTPPQESYSQDWLDQLTLHEYRHVVQLNNLVQGFTRLLNIVFGEAATGAVAGFLPLWFLEGDAVWSETVFSSSGRGRSADFDREFRAIELDKRKRYSYDQTYLGSYKHYTPDHYMLGYQMVSYANLKYGNNFWKQTINQVALKPYLIAPFYLGMRKTTKISKTKLYLHTFDSLKILWENNLDTSSSIINSNIYKGNTKFYTQYRYVQPAGEQYFALRSGINDITRFVVFNDSSEKVIYTPGFYNNSRVSVSGKYVAWEEVVPDMRWDQRSYSVIKILDIKTRKVKTLQTKTRWISPELSPGGDSLVCISIDQLNNFSLILFDIVSNTVIKEIPLNGISNVFSPVWISKNKIAFIELDREGKHIACYNLDENKKSILFNAGFNDIAYLAAGKNELFFSYDYEMARNIYRLDLSEQNIYRLTQSKHGADYPAYDPSGNQLCYSDYTLKGYRPVFLSLDSMTPKSINEIKKYTYPWISDIPDRKYLNTQETEIPQTDYIPNSYNRFLHAFNLHSWLPFYADPDALIGLDPEILPGFSLFSQNKISTLISQFSYYYKDHTHYIEPRFSIQGLYPVFEVSALFASKPSVYFWEENLYKPDDMQPYYTFTLETYLPLKLTRNKYYRYLQPKISYRYLNRYYYTPDIGIRRGYNYLEANIYVSNILKSSYRDIQPRFGQTLYLTFNHPVKYPEVFTHIIIAQYVQYLPGIFRHQGIRFVASYEEHEDLKVPILNNRITPPRGYEPDMLYYSNLRGVLEYTFPVLYPDLSLGPLAYIKRIHSTLYYDAATIRYPKEENNTYILTKDYFSSFGIILYSEIHFLRFFMPFEPAFRVSYLPQMQDFDIGFSITVNTSIF